MDRTVVLNIHATPEQAHILKQTLLEHTACFNAVVHEGWTSQCSNGVELHKQTYYPLRAVYPDLPAQLVCAARVKATETVKSALTWKRKQAQNYPKRVEKAKKQGKSLPVFKPVKCPQVKYCPIRYDARSYWLKWETSTCSLATVQGRIELIFTVPAYAQKYIGGKVCSADLCYRKGKWRLHVTVSVPEPTSIPSQEIIGVDLGLNRPAVTSNKHFLGERQWKEQERRIFRLRRKLQAKGTKSAKRHLKKLSGKLLRQRKDHDHVLSKRIVQHASPGSTIVLENLTYIRERAKLRHAEGQRRLHSWSFAQFHRFLSYKAQEQGIKVVKVDPRHTSQTCSKCGYQHRSNRRSQSLFLCRHCDYQVHADFNASLNIRNKYVASLADFGTSFVGGSPSSGLLHHPVGVGASPVSLDRGS
jgi:IS605 OrfB family transposase